MKLNFLTLITFFTFTHLVHAENHMLLMGGGGEPKGDSTIFDGGLIKLGKNLESAKWNYHVSFNGGHETTEEILKNQFSKSSPEKSRFTKDNYEELINNYIEKINNGEIKSGDQLMIIVNSHGTKAIEGLLTHSIAATGAPAKNSDDLAGASLVSLDSLQKILKLTEQKGIKLGIVDLSCHSGTSMALKKAIETETPNTCIITATGPDHYGNAGPNSFAENFMEELREGENLQDVFLKARIRSPFAEYPMISTQMNDKIVSDIYEGITPYLYYYYPKQDKLTPYILDNAYEGQICKREENFKNLISNIDNFSQLLGLNDRVPAPELQKKQSWSFFGLFNSNNTTIPKSQNLVLSSPYTEKLKKLLIQYKESQDKVIENLSSVDSTQLKNLENFDLSSQQKNTLISLKANYSWKELLSMDIDKDLLAYTKWQKNETSERRKKLLQEGIDFLTAVNKRKEQIIKDHPLLATLNKETESLTKNIQNSLELSQEISKQEKILYNALYQKYETENTNQSNPCKQITF